MAAPRTQFYHPAAAIDAGLHAIERSIRRAEGVALVVGQPGTGKSLLLAKIAENVRDDFDVAYLSGTRILTRRALWQSILAEIGEPYRGIDEVELRMAIVERIRGLAAAGSGLVILVDEAHTLPTRLIEELRLLTNVPTPLPAVHIVLAGGPKLEELLGLPRMESLTQRVAVRTYLEPLDHAETMAYLRSLPKAAGLDWDRLFGPGCDDAVFAATDGVPRLVNQICDQALVIAAAADRRATPADVSAAWREIQKLPMPIGAGRGFTGDGGGATFAASHEDVAPADAEPAAGVIEFGGLDDDPCAETVAAFPAEPSAAEAIPGDNPWKGPDVELVGVPGADPFEDLFRDDTAAARIETVECGDHDDAGDDTTEVIDDTEMSRESEAIARLLAEFQRADRAARESPHAARHLLQGDEPRPEAVDRSVDRSMDAEEADDSDMLVIEDDVDDGPTVFAVNAGDYRRLFTRLRRGDR